MATGLERLLLIIDADAKGAISGLEATGAAADANLTPIESKAAAAGAGTLAIGAAGIVSGVLIERGLGKANDAYVQLGNQTRQIQRLTGDTAEDASALVYVAAKSGVEFSALNTGIVQLSHNSGKLSEIGVSLEDDTGKARPFVDVLGDIADYFNRAGDSIDKTSKARDLFGRGGTAILPILNRGKAGIQELTAAAQDMGLTLSQGNVDDVVKFNASQRDLQQSLKATELAFGKAIDPAETFVLHAIASGITDVDKALAHIPDGVKEVGAVGLAVAGVAAAVGGAAALISFGAGKISKGFGDIGRAKDAIRGRLAGGISSGEITETDALIAARERLTVANDALAQSEARVAEASAAPIVSEAAAATVGPAIVSSAGAGRTAAVGAAATTSVESVGTAATVTGEQLDLAFTRGTDQLALFESGATKAAASTAEIGSSTASSVEEALAAFRAIESGSDLAAASAARIGPAVVSSLEEASGALTELAADEALALDALFTQTGLGAKKMSADLADAFTGGITGAREFSEVDPLVIASLERTALAAKELSPQLQAAFAGGIFGAEEFDAALLTSQTDMKIFGAEAVGVWEEIDAAAAKAAVTQAEAAAAPEISSGGGAGLLGGGLVSKTFLGVIGLQVGEQVADAITGSQDALDASLKHLEARAASGGKDVVEAFRTAANKQGAEFSASDLLPTHIFDEAFERFRLGGSGDSHPTQTFQKTFDSLMTAGGTSQAQSFVDSLKAQTQQLDHSSNDYKETEQLIRKWQRAIDDAKASQDAETASTRGEGAALDALGNKVDVNKDKFQQFSSSVSTDASPILGALQSQQGLQGAESKLQTDTDQLHKDQAGSAGLDPATQQAAIASTRDKVASANRTVEQSARALASADSDLSRAEAAAAHDPSDKTAADALTSARDRQRGATDALASSKEEAAGNSRDLADAEANEITQANALADARDKIAQATRSQAEAERSLSEARTTLEEDEQDLAHISQARDPRHFRDQSDKVQQDRDNVANGEDAVASARESKAAAQRDALATAATQKASQADTVATDLEQIASDRTAVISALVDYSAKFADLHEAIKTNPELLGDFNGLLDDMAAKGLVPAGVVSALKDQVNGLNTGLTTSLGLINTLAAISAFATGAQTGIAQTVDPLVQRVQSIVGGIYGGKTPPAPAGSAYGAPPVTAPKGVKVDPKTALPTSGTGSGLVEEKGSDGKWYYVDPGTQKIISPVGRKTGGPVSPDGFYEVGEEGFEILDLGGGRKGLLPGRDGTVQPHQVAAKAVAEAATEHALARHDEPASEIPEPWAPRGAMPLHRAAGGPVSPDGVFEVAEHGRTELLESGGRKFLLPGASGNVVSNSELTSIDAAKKGDLAPLWSAVSPGAAARNDLDAPSSALEFAPFPTPPAGSGGGRGDTSGVESKLDAVLAAIKGGGFGEEHIHVHNKGVRGANVEQMTVRGVRKAKYQSSRS